MSRSVSCGSGTPMRHISDCGQHCLHLPKRYSSCRRMPADVSQYSSTSTCHHVGKSSSAPAGTSQACLSQYISTAAGIHHRMSAKFAAQALQLLLACALSPQGKQQCQHVVLGAAYDGLTNMLQCIHLCLCSPTAAGLKLQDFELALVRTLNLLHTWHARLRAGQRQGGRQRMVCMKLFFAAANQRHTLNARQVMRLRHACPSGAAGSVGEESAILDSSNLSLQPSTAAADSRAPIIGISVTVNQWLIITSLVRST
ncbi:hypothetical protein MMC29_000574 [Sticta canariensis]|nr:hypothetical protein [Sticta canariensis]